MADDEMDSLFEGMVLFTPSQLAEQDLNQPSPRPASGDAPSSEMPIPSPSSQQRPLDENLFSDLTLVTPFQTVDDQPSPGPSSVSSTSTATAPISRQISRKKKRATGFRIGYGRDASFDDLSAQHEDDDITDSHQSLASNQLDLKEKPQERRQSSSVEDRDSKQQQSQQSLPDDAIDEKQQQSDSQSLPDEVHDGSQQQQQQQSDTQMPSTDSVDSESEFELVKAQVSDKLKLAREFAASVSAARKDSIRRRRKAAENLHLATVRHTELEQQLEEACEAEDFEAAERISESLAAADKEKQVLLLALREAEAQCDAIDSKMQEVLNCQIAAEEECASVLLHFSTDASENADSVLKKVEAQSSEEREKWLSSNEALEFRKIEVEIEAHLVNDARTVLNCSIDELIEDDKREKEFFCKKKDTLTDELQKLLALVKEKEKEIAENDSKIKEVEERIADAVSGFQDIQSSIDAKFDDLHSTLSQIDMESEALLEKKKETDKLLTAEEDRGAKLRELGRICADEAKMYQEVVGLRKSLMSSVLKSMEDKVRLAKTEEKLSEDVRMLQQDVSAARASLQELSSTRSSMQQNVSSLKQKMFFIDKRVPELEAEKKVAAAARNFKEAARIAAEAKSLSVEKEGVQTEMVKASLEIGKLDEEIQGTVDRVQEVEGLILSKEKELAMARFQRLLLIAGTAKAERLAALELGDLEEANLLLAEAEAADSEAKMLQPIYNFKEEELADLPKHMISMELVASLGQEKLAELAASIHLPAA